MGRKIAVLFGGNSTEYGVSLQSAASVIQCINTEQYDLFLIGIDRETGQWYWYQGETEWISEDCWKQKGVCLPVYPCTDKSLHGLCCMEKGRVNILSLDAAFPVLHGKNGEDGTVQGVLELAGIPVIGCGLLSSALCMDKEAAHCIAAAEGIRTARSVTLKKGYSLQRAMEAAGMLGYPLFVKPVRSGSSFGIAKVSEEMGLHQAIENAFRHDSAVMLEEMIEGFEVGCAVLGTDTLFTGAVDEIELSDGFFDYTEKYTLKSSRIHVPARIPAKKAEEIKRTALRLYRLLGCRCFARVDMFLTQSGEIYFNEVNTIPGFTAHSRFPNMLEAAGLSLEESVSRLLEME